MLQISEEHVKHCLEHGYTMVNDFLTPEEVAEAQKEIQTMFPSREKYAYAPTLYRNDYRGGTCENYPFRVMC